jgi:hypothetical protein
VRRLAIEQSEFIQIPGPNPILKPGPEGAWDDNILEASDAFEEQGTYYLYYHATNKGAHKYRLGVAASDHPLGPFIKYGDNPILEYGEEGSWDDTHVRDHIFSIGLATADSPMGPWEKYENNPVVEGFGYLGGVLKIDGKYRIYSAHRIHNSDAGERSPSRDYHSDYSPMGVAISDNPEGPFAFTEGELLLEKGQKGDWDEGGFSEAEVSHYNGMYHMFYGGTKLMGPRTENIGYAYSLDGFKWYKYGKNPVIPRKANPDVAAMAEVHAIIENPFVYLYYTLRPEERNGRKFPFDEDLGVSILVTERPFGFDIPVFDLDEMKPNQKTELEESSPIALDNISRISITAECLYAAGATRPVTIHIRSSSDGKHYDTYDMEKFTLKLKRGQLSRKTFDLKCTGRFVKIIIENNDPAHSVSDLRVNASVAG